MVAIADQALSYLRGNRTAVRAMSMRDVSKLLEGRTLRWTGYGYELTAPAKALRPTAAPPAVVREMEVLDSPFNRENYPELIGKRFPANKVPSYVRVKPVGVPQVDLVPAGAPAVVAPPLGWQDNPETVWRGWKVRWHGDRIQLNAGPAKEGGGYVWGVLDWGKGGRAVERGTSATLRDAQAAADSVAAREWSAEYVRLADVLRAEGRIAEAEVLEAAGTSPAARDAAARMYERMIVGPAAVVAPRARWTSYSDGPDKGGSLVMPYGNAGYSLVIVKMPRGGATPYRWAIHDNLHIERNFGSESSIMEAMKKAEETIGVTAAVEPFR